MPFEVGQYVRAASETLVEGRFVADVLADLGLPPSIVLISDATVQQLQNIGSTVITSEQWTNIGSVTAVQWAFLAGMDQAIASTSNVSFNSLIVTTTLTCAAVVTDYITVNTSMTVTGTVSAASVTATSLTTSTLTINEGGTIAIGNVSGSKIGGSGSKIGFYGATPIVQPSPAPTIATSVSWNITDNTGGTVSSTNTLVSTGTTAFDNNLATVRKAYNDLRTDYLATLSTLSTLLTKLKSLGLIAS